MLLEGLATANDVTSALGAIGAMAGSDVASGPLADLAQSVGKQNEDQALTAAINRRPSALMWVGRGARSVGRETGGAHAGRVRPSRGTLAGCFALVEFAECY